MFYKPLIFGSLINPTILYMEEGVESFFNREDDNRSVIEYIINLYEKHNLIGKSTYNVVILWKDNNGDLMVDVWLYSENKTSSNSGALADMKVFRKGEIDTDSGIGSEKSLSLIGFEAWTALNIGIFEQYILIENRPELPGLLSNGKDYFQKESPAEAINRISDKKVPSGAELAASLKDKFDKEDDIPENIKCPQCEKESNPAENDSICPGCGADLHTDIPVDDYVSGIADPKDVET
ncbi:MAG: hypothetical protein ABIB79_03085 [archaeon]